MTFQNNMEHVWALLRPATSTGFICSTAEKRATFFRVVICNTTSVSNDNNKLSDDNGNSSAELENLFRCSGSSGPITAQLHIIILTMARKLVPNL